MSDNDSAMARELHAAFQQVAPDLGFSYQDWAEMPDLERRLAVRACWQATQRRDFLPAVLEEADLEQVTKALARETVIRHVMAESGESREIVAEQVGAVASMDQEAVLDLMDGQPTTLRAALERYLGNIQPDDTGETVVDALHAILEYPYPGETTSDAFTTDALVAALAASGGLPIPTPYEFARRVEEQLSQRGYVIARQVVPYQCGQVEANQVHYPHDHGADGKPRCAGWTHAQAENR